MGRGGLICSCFSHDREAVKEHLVETTVVSAGSPPAVSEPAGTGHLNEQSKPDLPRAVFNSAEDLSHLSTTSHQATTASSGKQSSLVSLVSNSPAPLTPTAQTDVQRPNIADVSSTRDSNTARNRRFPLGGAVSPLTLEELVQEIQHLSWIGQGGYGTVYKGIWQGAPVAIKFMKSENMNMNTATAREALLSKVLSHPNVVQTFFTKVGRLDEEFFTLGSYGRKAGDSSMPTSSLDATTSFASGEGFGNPLLKSKAAASITDILVQLSAKPNHYLTEIVMEYCDSSSLSQGIEQGVFKPHGLWSQRLALRAFLRTAREVAQGMFHLHNSNVIHGDLKPTNVLLNSSTLDRRGFVAKVSDFGFSRVCQNPKQLIDVSKWSTIGYMAPEVFEDQLTNASDVYSFGMLLWEMYVGDHPYTGLNHGQIMVGVRLGELRPAWPSNAPHEVVSLSTKCLEQDHRKRPSFGYIIQELRLIEAKYRGTSTSAARTADNSQSEDNSGSGTGSSLAC